MAVRDRLPFEDLNHNDIRDTLNAHGGVCDNNEETYYLPTARINPWSRYKPFRDEDLFFTMDEWRNGKYRGENGQCGLDIPVYRDKATLVAALKDGSAMWRYLLPDGKTYPFRRIDFCGYNPNAVNPIGELAPLVYLQVTPQGYFFEINVEVVVSGENADYNLYLGDFEVNGIKLSDMYLGMYLERKGVGNPLFATGETPVGIDGLSTTIQGDSGSAGEYTAYLFLSELPQTSVGDGQSCTMVSLNKGGIDFQVVQHSKPYIWVSALWNKESGVVSDISLMLVNEYTSQFTFSNIYVNLVKVDKGGNPAEGEPMTPKKYSGSVAVDAKSDNTVYLSGIYTNIFPSDEFDYYIMGYADNTDSHYNQLEEEVKPALFYRLR